LLVSLQMSLHCLVAAALGHGPTHGWPCESPPCTKPAPPPGVITSRFEYSFEGMQYEGYVARPEHVPDKPLPIALVVHGMAGEGEIEQFRSDQLAHLGFIAFAVDLFGKAKRSHGESTLGMGLVTQSYADMERLHRQLAAQVDVLATAFPVADKANFVVAGYCFGGNIALEYARGAFPGLRAAVSFHGTFMSAPATAAVPPLTAVVQLHHADDDFQELDFGGGGGAWGGGSSASDGAWGGDSNVSSSAWGGADDRRLQAVSWGNGNDAAGGGGAWGGDSSGAAGGSGAWGGGGMGGMARKAVSVLTEIEDEMRSAGAERWMTIRYGRVGHAWTYPTSAEYKSFEAVSAHDASFALYRQLGLVTEQPQHHVRAGTPCAKAGAPCGHGLTCMCPESRRRLLFATLPCVCSAVKA